MFDSLQTSRIALAGLLLTPCILLADGWSEVWPSQANPRQGYRQLSECYSSTVERCSAAGTTLPSAPTWYRSNRGVLIDCKTRLASAIPLFLDTNLLASATPLANAYFTNRPGVSTTFAFCSVTGLLVSCSLPTNYFTYTPYRSLSGLGAETNDTTTTYPHGFTNAYTASGGTNYPPGRSAWYSTDYGWNAWPRLMSNLLWTTQTASWSITNTWGNYVHYPESYDTTEAGMQAKVDAAYQSPDPGPTYVYHECCVESEHNAANSYDGAKKMRQYYSKITSLPATLQKQVEWYAWSTNTARSYSGSGGATFSYTNWGLNLVENVYTYVGISTSSTNTTMEYTWGSTNLPSWIAAGGLYSLNSLGFTKVSGSASRPLIRWDVVGGFQFK